MTQGEYRVGIHFNPSEDNAVDRLKQKAAAFIDECQAQLNALYPNGVGSLEVVPEWRLRAEKHSLYDRAMREAEGAAMWGVKAATKRAMDA